MLTEPGPKGPRIARQSGMTCYAHPMRPESKGHIHIASADPQQAAGDQLQLPVVAGRCRAHRARGPHRPLDHDARPRMRRHADQRDRARRRTGPRDDEILDWVKKAGGDDLPSRRHLQDGLGRPWPSSTPSLRVHGIARPARRRRLDHADAHLGQHQRAVDHDRREGGGDGAGGRRLMSIAEPGPASFAALRDAMLKGHEPPPLQAVARLASYRWVVVGTVCVGAFMGQVDASLTQMLLPRLERDFHAPLSTVSWVAVAYILTMASFMPIFGRLADMIGRKLLYTGAFLLFVIGSGLCGFAPDLPDPDRLPHRAGHRRRTAHRQQHRHRRPCRRPRASRPRARPAVGGAGDRAGSGTGGRRPGARHAGLALGVLDQRAVRPAGPASRLVRAAADPASAKRRPLRLAWRLPDRARAHRHRRDAERGPCLGRDLARLHLLQRGGGHPSGVVRPRRTARHHAADRLRAAAPARLPDRQPRELPVLRRAVRRVLPHPLRAGPRLPGLRACRGPADSRSCR